MSVGITIQQIFMLCKQESIEAVFPLVRKYGGVLVALVLDGRSLVPARKCRGSIPCLQ